MADVNVQLTGAVVAGAIVQWPDDVSLGATFSRDGSVQELTVFRVTTAGALHIGITAVNSRFTDAFETSGRIILTSSAGMVLEVVGTGGDMTEAYDWTADNSAEVIAFANHIIGLTDRDVALRLTDDPPAITVTANLSNYSRTSLTITWSRDASLGTAFSRDGNELFLNILTLFYTDAIDGEVEIFLRDERRFTDAFVATGRIIITARDGVSVEVMIADADTTSPYTWRPPNHEAVASFANHVRRRLGGGTATLTLTNEPLPPDFMPHVPMVDDQQVIVGTAFTTVLDAAIGGDAPIAYTAAPLPTGMTFDANTRTLSGTPTQVEDVTVTYTATDTDGDVASTTFDFNVLAARPLGRNINLGDAEISGVFLGDVAQHVYEGSRLLFGGVATQSLWQQTISHAHCAVAARFTTHAGSQDVKYDTRPAGTNHAGTLLNEFWDGSTDVNELSMLREIQFFQNVGTGGPFRLFRSEGDNTSIGGLNWASTATWQSIYRSVGDGGLGLGERTFVMLIDASGDNEYLVLRLSDLADTLIGTNFMNPGTAVPAISTFADISEFNDWGSRVRQDLVGRELIWAMFRYLNDADVFDFTPTF